VGTIVTLSLKLITWFCAALAFFTFATLAQAQIGTGNGTGAGSGNGNGNGNGNITGNVGGSTVTLKDRRQAPAVVAPGLTAAGIEACLGSVSVGGSGAGFGLTVGSTTLDKGCNIRLYARTLNALGYRTAATQMLCYDPEVAGALAIQGIRCEVGPLAVPQTGVAGVQQPAQRVVQAAEAAPAPKPKCMRYDIFRGCLD
jgi:hypothetical protein